MLLKEGIVMGNVARALDFSPLFRTAVGFDRISQLAERALADAAAGNGYPPYDIEAVGENAWRITLAVAGFRETDLEIETKDGVLVVKGNVAAGNDAGSKPRYLHQGIAARQFERRFHLADHLKVTGASLDLGLLHIDLVREVPEALKPRRIEIAAA
jgi:molecular chaperone IbpA